MATETEQLLVSLEARIAAFEKNMAKASGTANREFGAIERRGQQSAKRMQGVFAQVGSSINTSLKGIGGGFLAGGIAGLVSEATLRRIGDVVKSVADMADEAERVKLPVEDFQALGFSARQAGIEAEKVTDLFQKFQLEVAEAASKGNDLAKILEANNVPLLDANGKIREQKALFYDVVNLIKNAGTQQEAAQIAMAAFGKGAADALPFLQQGADAIREGEQAARDTGAIISKELVEKAREFDDRWTATWDSWTARGKSAVLEVLSELQGLGPAIDNFIKSHGITSDSLRGSGIIPGLNPQQIKELEGIFPSLKSDSTANDEARLVELTKQRAELEQRIADTKAAGTGFAILPGLEEELAGITRQVDELQAKLDKLKSQGPAVGPGPAFEQHGRGTPPALPSTTIIPPLGGTGKKDASDLIDPLEKAEAAAIEAAQRKVESYRQLIQGSNEYIASQNMERDALGMTARGASALRHEYDLLNEAQRAGIELTPEQRGEIQQLAQGMASAEQATLQYAQTQQQTAQISQAFGQMGLDALTGIINGTMTAKQALAQLAQQLIKLTLQALLLGQGPLAGLFGGTGGGGAGGSLLGFAEGGFIRGKGTGTSDSNLAAVSDGEFIVNARATQKHRAALEALNSGRIPAFAHGGFVSRARTSGTSSGSGMSMSNTFNIDLGDLGGMGVGGSMDATKAANFSKTLENAIRTTVLDVIMKERRSGGLLYGV